MIKFSTHVDVDKVSRQSGHLRSDQMTILDLPSVMRLYNEYFNSNIHKLNCRMILNGLKIMLIGQAICLNNQKYPQNRCYTVSLENCFVLWVRRLKPTVYVHIK